MKFVVAIDGPAAAGKGTIAREIAAIYGFAYLDTGLLYRAVARNTLASNPDVLDLKQAEINASSLLISDLESDDLRTPEIAKAASEIAVVGSIRKILTEFQRQFANQCGGAILDGRDIGTVICPKADVKVFVTASEEERAKRRHAELSSKGYNLSLETVIADIRQRDTRDSERTAAPMVPAKDAVLIDTSRLSIDRAVARTVEFINRKYKPMVK